MYLSIIVPFFNVEKNLNKCLDSLIYQNISPDKYEIICIDDCSTDRSKDIVLEYIRNFPNIRIIEHSINKKVGGSRNTGFNEAKGDYVWFVDSDDFIFSNVLNKILNKCKQYDLDVLAFNITTVSVDGHIINKESAFKDMKNIVYSGSKLLKDTFGNQLIYHLGYSYRGVFKREYLIKINARFPENISYGEDTIFMARSILYAQRVMSFSDSFYYYRQNPSSVTNQLEVQMKGHLIFQSIINAGSYVVTLINECKEVDQVLADNLASGMPWFVNRIISRILKANFNERRIFFTKLSEQMLQIYQLLPYMNKINYIVSKYPKLGFLITCVLKPFYIFNKRFK